MLLSGQNYEWLSTSAAFNTFLWHYWKVLSKKFSYMLGGKKIWSVHKLPLKIY